MNAQETELGNKRAAFDLSKVTMTSKSCWNFIRRKQFVKRCAFVAFPVLFFRFKEDIAESCWIVFFIYYYLLIFSVGFDGFKLVITTALTASQLPNIGIR